MHTIEIIRSKIHEHESVLSQNESMTRYVLVDPLLQGLGWDLSDPNQVETEVHINKNSYLDYMLGRKIIIEAKKLGARLDDSREQLLGYMKDEKELQYGILTNGNYWRIFTPNSTSISCECEIKSSDVGNTLSVLSKFYKQLIQLPSNNMHSSQVTDSNQSSEEQVDKQKIVCLDKVVVKKHTKPLKIIFPDNNSVQLNTWIGVLEYIVEYLIKNNKLKKEDLPIPPEAQTYIINTKPKHKARNFIRYKKICGMYIDVNISGQCCVQNAIKLIKATNTRLPDFKLVLATS